MGFIKKVGKGLLDVFLSGYGLAAQILKWSFIIIFAIIVIAWIL